MRECRTTDVADLTEFTRHGDRSEPSSPSSQGEPPSVIDHSKAAPLEIPVTGALTAIDAAEPVVQPVRPARRNDDYTELKQLVAAQGLLAKSGMNYSRQAVQLTVLFIVTASALVLANSTPLQLLCALPAALLFGQLAFIGHDSAHLQVFKSSRKNYILSVLMFNLALGASRGWWTDRHNRHHANTNDLVADPDFGSDVLAYAPEQVKGTTGFTRFMVRNQANFFGGLLFLQTMNSRYHTTRFLQVRKLRNWGMEVGLIGAHYAIYVAVIFWAIGWKTGMSFIALHELLFSGYLGLAFITNHVGMAIPTPGENVGFLRAQATTSRNLKDNRVTDYLFGALTCQIEHHLFPAMPRNHLRAAAPIVRDFCRARGVEYHETTLLGALREVRQELWRAAKIRAMDEHTDLRTILMAALRAYLQVPLDPPESTK